MNECLVFSYSLQDAWGFTISTVKVFDCGSGGLVRCTRLENMNEISSELPISLPDVDKIKKIIGEHEYFLTCKGLNAVESPFVLDGFINTFEFSIDGKKVNEVTCFNISFFRDSTETDKHDNKPVKAWELLELFDEISAILLKSGVTSDYLSLD